MADEGENIRPCFHLWRLASKGCVMISKLGSFLPLIDWLLDGEFPKYKRRHLSRPRKYGIPVLHIKNTSSTQLYVRCHY